MKYYYKQPFRVHLEDTNISLRRKILNEMTNKGIELLLNTRVMDIDKIDDTFTLKTNQGMFQCKHLIIATGGMSYKELGSRGDGYNFAKSFKINVTPLYPIGVGLHTHAFDKKLQGISLDDVKATVFIDNKEVYSETGPFMFTHYGIGGPVIRRVSGYISKALMNKQKCVLSLSFIKENEV